MLFGYALAMQGPRRARGWPTWTGLGRCRATNGHYALGWGDASGGHYAAAAASSEMAMTLRPGLYDVERELPRLRPLVAAAPAR